MNWKAKLNGYHTHTRYYYSPAQRYGALSSATIRPFVYLSVCLLHAIILAQKLYIYGYGYYRTPLDGGISLSRRRGEKSYVFSFIYSSARWYVGLHVIHTCTLLARYRERKCADTTGTALVPWAGHFQC